MERKELFALICKELEANGAKDIYYNGDEIICGSQERADVIADFLEALGIDTVMTGRNNSNEYYITID